MSVLPSRALTVKGTGRAVSSTSDSKSATSSSTATRPSGSTTRDRGGWSMRDHWSTNALPPGEAVTVWSPGSGVRISGRDVVRSSEARAKVRR